MQFYIHIWELLRSRELQLLKAASFNNCQVDSCHLLPNVDKEVRCCELRRWKRTLAKKVVVQYTFLIKIRTSTIKIFILNMRHESSNLLDIDEELYASTICISRFVVFALYIVQHYKHVPFYKEMCVKRVLHKWFIPLCIYRVYYIQFRDSNLNTIKMMKYKSYFITYAHPSNKINSFFSIGRVPKRRKSFYRSSGVFA